MHYPSNLLIISTLLLGSFNLLIPLVSKAFLRNFLLLLVSFGFLINVLIIDWLYLEGMRISISFFTLNNFSFAFSLEPLGLIFLSLVSILWIFALIYSLSYLEINNIHQKGKFIFFLNLCIVIGCFLSLAANLISMFVCYELLTLATIPLISHLKNNQTSSSLDKYLKILLFTSVGFLLPAIIIIYCQIGHGDFVLHGFIRENFTALQAKILLLLVVFGIGKAALLPFYGWLIAAMSAPYPVSALLHAVIVVKAGLFCIFKFIVYVFGLDYLREIFSSNYWLIYLPLVTVIYSSIKACMENNLKMILAYSTINHLSIALLGAFMFTPRGMLASLLHMLSHSFAKICLFYGMGALYSLKKIVTIDDLKNLGSLAPKINVIILLSMLSLIGIPPFGGFISKYYLLSSAVESKQYDVLVAITISSLLSAYYFTRILMRLAQPQNAMIEVITKDKLPKSMSASVGGCCILSISFFLFLPLIIKLTFYIL